MNKNVKYIIIALLVFSSILCVISITYFETADVVAVYTRNNLFWSNAEFFDDGAVKLDLKHGKTSVRLKNDVKGNIGFCLYLYDEKEIANAIKLSAKGMTEIGENAYPASLAGCDVKCAYRGVLAGNEKKNFVIESTGDTEIRLLMIIEDNNSYPKTAESIPTLANVKLNAEVLLDGQYARGREYAFTLKDEEGGMIETVQNDDGYISFSNIALKEKGTYIYYLSQSEGKNKKTIYDKSVYKISVVAEAKNEVQVFYEKDGVPKETLPRFSNYKESTPHQNSIEYPTNEKKASRKPNFLLWSTLAIGILLALFYGIAHRKGNAKND